MLAKALVLVCLLGSASVHGLSAARPDSEYTTFIYPTSDFDVSTQRPSTVHVTTNASTSTSPSPTENVNTTATAIYPTATPCPSNFSSGPTCVNDPLQVWSDVMFVIESSGTTSNNFMNMWYSVVALSESFTIEQHGYPFKHYMQVGVVVYGDVGVVAAQLGSVNNLYNVDPTFLGSKTGAANLADGLTKASDQLKGPNARPNSKKIIYLIADDVNTEGFEDPQEVSDHFRKSGGIIIARAVKPEHGPVPVDLKNIASSGYYLNENSTVDDETLALTESGCFCPVGTLPYSLNQNPRGTPTAGCYVPIDLSYTFQTAKALCRQRHNANVVSVQTAEKSSFLRDLLPGHVIWTGLSYDGEWVWQDGSPLGCYQPWGTMPSTTQHAMLNTNGLWYAADARTNTPRVVCESAPCDSLNYCE